MLAKVQQQTRSTSSTTTYDAVVIGAGPYGLAAAAHLRKQGLNIVIFGKTLELWRDHMPNGMFLRSHWWASSISDPAKQYTFERFLQETKKYGKVYPVPIEAYIEYGLWFQERVVPEVDETYVTSIERNGDEFTLILADDRVIKSQMVIMAIGMKYYARRPAEYAHLSPELVSHGVDHNDFSRYADKTVVVVGGGQSATEYSALLHEAGANVHLVARHPIHWLEPDRSEGRSLWEQIKKPRAKIALGWRNVVLERLPYLFSHFPQEKRERYIRRNYQASANDWLWDRLVGKVTLHEGQEIKQIEEIREDGSDRVSAEVTLSDGTHLKADHVMFATGYAVDVRKLPMLDSSLLDQIEMNEGIPSLNSCFESSVPGLYFIGMTTLHTFGPFYRFVFGNQASAQRITRVIAAKLRKTKKR